MVSIDNKTNSASNLVGIKQNISPDEVDMLFAELFALVHSGNNEEYTENDSNIYNIDKSEGGKNTLYTQNNNSRTEDLAKSLVQIFYKDVGITQANEPKSEVINLSKNKNILSKNLNNQILTINDSNKTSENGQKLVKSINSEKKINTENISVAVSFKPPKKNTKSDFKVNSGSDLKISNLGTESKLGEIKGEKNNNEGFDLKKKITNQPELVSEKKKIRKRKQSFTTNVNNEEENQIIKNKNPLKQNFNQIITSSKKNLDISNNIQKLKKEKNTQLLENKTRPTKLFATPEILNLMESSWGEKFSKMIKNAVTNGLNKVEITLKPKSLGKINLDISVKDNTTKIQINAENIESANILNENLGKLNELIESKNDKFSNFFEGNSNNNFNNPKKKKVIDNQQIVNKKKSIDNKKTIISNHNIDVQA
mgnify:CR=1 FL=1